MIFQPTGIHGVLIVEPEELRDERGFFARMFCSDEFTRRGLAGEFSQVSISHNLQRGTLRGLHFQIAPHQEVKLVRCTAGAIFDVLLDLRADSATFGRWVGVELNAQNRRQMYVPEGVAHGFQTLLPQSEVLYHITAPHHAASARGVRWDDPAFGIDWPLPVASISERDRSYPDFSA